MYIMHFRFPSIPINLFQPIALGMLIVSILSSKVEALPWPCFHGQDRTNSSAETGLLKSWPKGGPTLVWSDSGLGEGYSSISVTSERIYTAGSKNGQTFVYAFDQKGTALWASPNGAAWETTKSWARGYTGSRSTPTYDNGIIYHLSEKGQLTAFNSINGKVVWSIDLTKKYDAEVPDYGYSESVIIEGDHLYCNAVGKKAFGICLDKKTGGPLWTNLGIAGTAAFSSQILADFGGYRQLIGQSSELLYGVDSKSGKTLWTVPFKNDRENSIPDPIFYKGNVFGTSGYGKGSLLVKLVADNGAIKAVPVWESKLMDNLHGGAIQHNGYVYGAGDKSKGWTCLDIMTGKQMWNASGKGSITYADSMLYCLEENGTMKLIKASPEKYEEAGTFSVPRGGKGMHWAHPVISGGRLYVRHADKLFVYDVTSKH